MHFHIVLSAVRKKSSKEKTLTIKENYFIRAGQLGKKNL